ncbi:helix-turn-helix domain-containing protein [Mucilaginibacter jinjuensis]|uniref:Helix-turn-helix domain-containing protein n=1 Tax=Mucilaginibacter jinjuensis TaxID=1176721 RepID=A0ABY7T6G0_9SPHI|nr:helix-turn-helix domain-containing protein [Mucilaginibacter jinjuensis]WCT11971.1 helix-turn-helix domain-containing protein [Mucilaginibacter jinjuensis]
MKTIPVHQLKDRGVPSGIDMHHFVPGELPAKVGDLGAHRDDHYLFFLLEDGHAELMIDFHKMDFYPNSLYYILPGQVHHRIKGDIAHGWYIAVDPMLISPEYRNVFETQLILQQPYVLDEKHMQQCQSLLNLLSQKHKEDQQSTFQIQILHSLLQSFVGMVACCYNQQQTGGIQLTRPLQLSQQFKKLLSENIHTVKSPSAYAAKLNVSESYLNEALKKATGFSVSYWITQEVVMEAKRLLYYSELNVKQIAHNLGYDDHTYFSRLFKKSTDETPLGFRTQHRK